MKSRRKIPHSIVPSLSDLCLCTFPRTYSVRLPAPRAIYKAVSCSPHYTQQNWNYGLPTQAIHDPLTRQPTFVLVPARSFHSPSPFQTPPRTSTLRSAEALPSIPDTTETIPPINLISPKQPQKKTTAIQPQTLPQATPPATLLTLTDSSLLTQQLPVSLSTHSAHRAP